MSLEHIFYVSQSIAAVAVIASLLYLAQQVRQAERVQRATMQQGRADRTSQASLAVASSELARVLQKGMAGDTELTREEFTQWMWMCRALFLSGEDSFLQHEAGMLSDAAFDSYVAGVNSISRRQECVPHGSYWRVNLAATFARSVVRCWLRPRQHRKTPTVMLHGVTCWLQNLEPLNRS